jgi:hypothetical protein
MVERARTLADNKTLLDGIDGDNLHAAGGRSGGLGSDIWG